MQKPQVVSLSILLLILALCNGKCLITIHRAYDLKHFFLFKNHFNLNVKKMVYLKTKMIAKCIMNAYGLVLNLREWSI